MRTLTLWFLAASAIAALISWQEPVCGEDSNAALRRPIAVVCSASGERLLVANRDAGTVSVVDVRGRRVLDESKIGRRLADLAAIPRTPRLLAVDEIGHELVLLSLVGETVRVERRLAISPYPVSLVVAPDGRWASVASLWSRRLTFVSLDGSPKIERVIDLPFAPRAQLALPEHNRLVVADGFGGKLALVDLAERKVAGIREIPGHNIRGLGQSASGQMLVVSHQMLNDLAHSIRNDIHWGLLMSNDLRWLKVDSVLKGADHLYHGGHMHPLGDPNRGGGDPGALAVAGDGTVVVTISGVNEVAFGKEGDFSMQRLKVGRRPTAVCLAPDGKMAYIANTFDDSVTILDLERRQVAATLALGPAAELTVAQRGEQLFYDARLSHDGWMSCHSCHTDGHANGQMNDNFSDRSFGAAKRVPSLLGVNDTLPLAWNGQVQSFERQIHNSVENTMQREETLGAADVAALAAYLKTLEIPPSQDLLRQTSDQAAIARGRQVFERRDCASCHAPPSYTSPGVYDVGLTDSQGAKEFNPPSLRGLSHREPLFHDSSAATLEDVFRRHGHPANSPYSPGEIGDLVAFLRSL